MTLTTLLSNQGEICMTQARIYAVTSTTGEHLVKASNPAQALRFIAKNEYQVRVISALDVVDMMTGGATVADATTEPA
jgi:hypothetical protein